MYTYEDLLNIIKTLRSPQGCPWDREQTHQSLKPCMMEEAAEVVAAIRIYDKTGSFENLVEELGDVLLQVVMHAEIAEEEGLFTMEDVADHIAAKMVRRHPHVFGTVQVDGSSQVLANWEEIKSREKEGRDYIESPLREIPGELPALTRAPKVMKRVDKLYEKQPSFQESVKALREAAAGLEKLGGQPSPEEVAGLEKLGGQPSLEEAADMVRAALLAVSQISRSCGLQQEQILSDAVEDLIEQYEPLSELEKR